MAERFGSLPGARPRLDVRRQPISIRDLKFHSASSSAIIETGFGKLDLRPEKEPAAVRSLRLPDFEVAVEPTLMAKAERQKVTQAPIARRFR